jgi:hypothetical protein
VGVPVVGKREPMPDERPPSSGVLWVGPLEPDNIRRDLGDEYMPTGRHVRVTEGTNESGDRFVDNDHRTWVDRDPELETLGAHWPGSQEEDTWMRRLSQYRNHWVMRVTRTGRRLRGPWW